MDWGWVDHLDAAENTKRSSPRHESNSLRPVTSLSELSCSLQNMELKSSSLELTRPALPNTGQACQYHQVRVGEIKLYTNPNRFQVRANWWFPSKLFHVRSMQNVDATIPFVWRTACWLYLMNHIDRAVCPPNHVVSTKPNDNACTWSLRYFGADPVVGRSYLARSTSTPNHT